MERIGEVLVVFIYKKERQLKKLYSNLRGKDMSKMLYYYVFIIELSAKKIV